MKENIYISLTFALVTTSTQPTVESISNKSIKVQKHHLWSVADTISTN
jgi:hypothetical protein